MLIVLSAANGLALASTVESMVWGLLAAVTSEAEQLDELMERLAEGDRSVFTSLFEGLWAPTVRLCRSMLGNDADAADAAQQALEKIFVRAADYEPGRPALPWALAIASWECRTILRRRSRRREVSDDFSREPASTAPADDLHVHNQLVEAALQALGTLSEQDRETLIATYWEEAASVPGATFRKRRERALGRLRRAFRRLYGLG